MRRTASAGAWLELFRVSNAPTVVTNVLAGTAVGMHARLGGSAAPFWSTVGIAVSCLSVYVAGMVLNDAFDARVDARERPGRPIPSGRVSPGSAIAAGLVLLAAGTAGLVLVSPGTAGWALLLAGCVLAYDILHLYVPGALVLVAACRGLVPVVAAFATSAGAEWSLLQWVAGGSFAYAAAVGAAAKNEVRGFGRVARVASWILPIAACAPLGMWFAEGVAPEGALVTTVGVGAMAIAVVSVVAGVRLAGSGAFRFTVPAAVGVWLGAIPAIDTATCFLLGHPLLGFVCIGLWGMAGALRPRFASS